MPLEEHRAWDSADVVSARIQGWRTHVARDLPFRHHRAIGTRDGSRLRAWAGEGVGAYSIGYRPLYLLIRSLYHSVNEPAAIGLVMGYVAAFLRRSPRTSRPVRRFVRQEQTLTKLATRAREVRGKRGPAPEGQHGVELLLVTEPGGPLLELCALHSVWAGRSRVWATLPGPDSGFLLHEESVLLARGPTCRSLINLIRNLWIAWRAVGRYRPAVILATGSGIVVPFIWVGRLRGVRTIFLECGGVVERPSLSCRLVARSAQFIYVQWPELISSLPSARYAGTVPWQIGNAAGSQIEGRRGDGLVVVVVGTSLVYPFDRLVRSLQSISGVRPVIVQRGISFERPARATVFDFVDFDELAGYVAEAQLVITHGGIGSVLLALAHGKHPIVMPRRQGLGEAVDDHQVAFAKRLEQEGLAKVVNTEAELMTAVLSPGPRPVAQASEHTLAGELEALVEELLPLSSNRRSVTPTGSPAIRVPRYR
jgi:UDP-N-acetylglucosamine transferase subunit ALG13